MKRIIFSILLCMVIGRGSAQTESPSSQLLMNPRMVNPAYKAVEDRIEGNLMYKDQWTGFEGAPQILHLNARLPFRRLLGIGVAGNYEKSGLRKNTQLGVTSDVHIRLGQSSWLQFGLHLGAGLKRYDLGQATTDPGEVIAEKYDRNYFIGGYGLSWRWKNLEIGASHYLSFLGEEEGEMHNVYLQGEYSLPIGQKWLLRPAVLYSYNNLWENRIEPGVFCTYADVITLGISDRIDEHVTISAALRVMKLLALTYSYDINTGDIRKLASSSHEIGISFCVGKK